MSRRALEIGSAVAAWQARGGLVGFGTFTVRHHKGQGLIAVWDAVQRGWARVTQGSSWISDKGRYGVFGWVRVVEVTIGRHGWHVHVHALFLLDGKVTQTGMAAFHAGMFGRWSAGVTAAGFRAPLMVGQDFRLVTDGDLGELARYFSKAVDMGGTGSAPHPRARGEERPSSAHAVALEFTQTQTKGARDGLGTVPPWRLLDSVLEDGCADSLDSWHEWERGSKGRRQITWSGGLRKALGLAVEKSDDDVAAEELGGSDLLLITSEGWREMVRQYRLIPQLLSVTESGGLAAARDFLTTHRIEFMEV
jgi:hypothetical protein